MRAAARIIKYQFRNVIRSRWLLGYTGFFLLASELLLRFGGDPTRALVSLMNVVLLMIPLVTIVFGTMYLYDAREFVELLLAQPIGRRQLFAGLYLGVTLPLALGFAAGVALPFAFNPDQSRWPTLAALLIVGIALTFIFTALAFAISLRWDDRIKGLGVAIATWLVLGVVYDAFVLMAATMFSAYPLDKAMLALMIVNPIDLARTVLLMGFDISALMGYTGALFKQFFGTGLGMAVAGAALIGWVGAPVLYGDRSFESKDF